MTNWNNAAGCPDALSALRELRMLVIEQVDEVATREWAKRLSYRADRIAELIEALDERADVFAELESTIVIGEDSIHP